MIPHIKAYSGSSSCRVFFSATLYAIWKDRKSRLVHTKLAQVCRRAFWWKYNNNNNNTDVTTTFRFSRYIFQEKKPKRERETEHFNLLTHVIVISSERRKEEKESQVKITDGRGVISYWCVTCIKFLYIKIRIYPSCLCVQRGEKILRDFRTQYDTPCIFFKSSWSLLPSSSSPPPPPKIIMLIRVYSCIRNDRLRMTFALRPSFYISSVKVSLCNNSAYMMMPLKKIHYYHSVSFVATITNAAAGETRIIPSRRREKETSNFPHGRILVWTRIGSTSPAWQLTNKS